MFDVYAGKASVTWTNWLKKVQLTRPKMPPAVKITNNTASSLGKRIRSRKVTAGASTNVSSRASPRGRITVFPR